MALELTKKLLPDVPANGSIRHPEIRVKLIDEDGNIFSIMGRCVAALTKYGYTDEIKEFINFITSSSDYHIALSRVMQWFDVY